MSNAGFQVLVHDGRVDEVTVFGLEFYRRENHVVQFLQCETDEAKENMIDQNYLDRTKTELPRAMAPLYIPSASLDLIRKCPGRSFVRRGFGVGGSSGSFESLEGGRFDEDDEGLRVRGLESFQGHRVRVNDGHEAGPRQLSNAFQSRPVEIAAIFSVLDEPGEKPRRIGCDMRSFLAHRPFSVSA